MRHTLTAVFDQRSDAQHVLDELLAAGYPGTDASIAGDAEPDSSLRQLLTRLFSRHKAGHGRYILTLTAGSDPDAQRALGIIERLGPLGVEDNAEAEWHGPRTAAGGRRRAYPVGTAPGSLQHRFHDDTHYFGTQNASAPPSGNTFKESLGSTGRWDVPEDEDMYPAFGDAYGGTSADIDNDGYYRTHWNARYANDRADSRYEDHLPAYMYGDEARRMEAYRSRHWEQVEDELRTDWEAHHEDQLSPWENFKDAVKHGWDRIDFDTEKQH
jgi:hypothetical protein